jgi:hypothetical protein
MIIVPKEKPVAGGYVGSFFSNKFTNLSSTVLKYMTLTMVSLVTRLVQITPYKSKKTRASLFVLDKWIFAFTGPISPFLAHCSYHSFVSGMYKGIANSAMVPNLFRTPSPMDQISIRSSLHLLNLSFSWSSFNSLDTQRTDFFTRPRS